MDGFWATKIRSDAENGKSKSLGDYLASLMPEEEQFESSMDRMFERLDRQIARQEARKAREASQVA